MRDRTEAQRRIERAEIERWFSSDAFGAYFHAADGRAWPIDDAGLAHGKARAFATIDAMLGAGRRQAMVSVALVIGAAVAMPPAVPPSWQGPVMGAIVGLLFAGAVVRSFAGLALLRRRLRGQRAEIAAAIAAPALGPADQQRYARTNLFRIAQYVWVAGTVILLAAMQLPVGFAFLKALGGAGTLLAVAAVMGGAWGLYFAAEQVDRVQAKPRERLGRIPYAARDSWSQAD